MKPTLRPRAASAVMTLLILCLIPSVASADIFSIWFVGKGDTFGGTGDLFENFDRRFGGGAEVGMELLFFSLFGEAIVMDTDQYLFTANAGVNFSVGTKVRLTLGAYTGPLFFLFPEQELEGVNLSALSDEQTKALGFDTRAELEAEFDTVLARQNDLSRLAIGWNLGRARAELEFQITKGFYFGFTGQVGYHLLISGEDIAAGAKNAALDVFAQENKLPDEAVDPLRDALGAKGVDPSSLEGLNYEANLHLKIDIGF